MRDKVLFTAGLKNVGLPVVQIHCMGQTLNMLLDSGASFNILSAKTRNRLSDGLKTFSDTVPIVGVDGNTITGNIVEMPFQLGKSHYRELFCAINNDIENSPLLRNENFPVDGILSTNFLYKHFLIMDFSSCKIYRGTASYFIIRFKKIKNKIKKSISNIFQQRQPK